MAKRKEYSKNEVIDKLEELIANLGNGILDRSGGVTEGDQDMPKRLAEKLKVNGQEKWIHGYSVQELYDNYVKLLVREGVIEWVDMDDAAPFFGEYLRTYYDTFKQKQEQNTIINRNRIVKNHIEPVFGMKRIDRIRTMELQRWFNTLAKQYSRETILKIKNIMSPVFDAAVEDDLIAKNPLASKRIEIGGKETVHHKAIPKEKLLEIKMAAGTLPDKERIMAGLLCYTGMRFEEVLGLRWDDICDGWITVKRAVVHPKRNMPEVKKPKTKTSERRIPLNDGLKTLLSDGYKQGYLLASDKDPKRGTPLSYTESRRIFDKIRKRFGIQEYSAHDFRDTCATEWRENGMSLDVIARLLGHSKTETTEKRYVKYRDDLLEGAKNQM